MAPVAVEVAIVSSPFLLATGATRCHALGRSHASVSDNIYHAILLEATLHRSIIF